MDGYGPEKVLQTYCPSSGSLGLLVVDNTRLGPGLGEIRFAEKVSVEQACSLARRYTVMNSLFGLPFGGGCAFLVARGDRKSILREFGSSVSSLANDSFVACPSHEIGQTEMEAYAFASGDVRGTVGKPASLKGIPFEVGGRGLGLAHCILEATGKGGSAGEFRVSLLGLGRDSLFAARVLAKRGAKVVAASDSGGATANEAGLDVDSLSYVVRNGGSVQEFGGGKPETPAGAACIGCDVALVSEPAFSPILGNSPIGAKTIVEGSVGALGSEAENLMEGKGIPLIPDILACGGGSVSAHIERMGGGVVDMNEVVANSVRRVTREVLDVPGKSVRKVAERIALGRIEDAG
jgi:glutamate dehydrogenase (NAD(P)+)